MGFKRDKVSTRLQEELRYRREALLFQLDHAGTGLPEEVEVKTWAVLDLDASTPELAEAKRVALVGISDFVHAAVSANTQKRHERERAGLAVLIGKVRSGALLGVAAVHAVEEVLSTCGAARGAYDDVVLELGEVWGEAGLRAENLAALKRFLARRADALSRLGDDVLDTLLKKEVLVRSAENVPLVAEPLVLAPGLVLTPVALASTWETVTDAVCVEGLRTRTLETLVVLASENPALPLQEAKEAALALEE